MGAFQDPLDLDQVSPLDPVLDDLRVATVFQTIRSIEFFFLDITTSLFMQFKYIEVISYLSHWFAGKILRVR